MAALGTELTRADHQLGSLRASPDQLEVTNVVRTCGALGVSSVTAAGWKPPARTARRALLNVVKALSTYVGDCLSITKVTTPGAAGVLFAKMDRDARAVGTAFSRFERTLR